jgi:hypothetical protein
MSKRHQSNRRRSYGRRQHEIRERVERVAVNLGAELGHDQAAPEHEPLSFFDLDLRRLSYAVGD